MVQIVGVDGDLRVGRHHGDAATAFRANVASQQGDAVSGDAVDPVCGYIPDGVVTFGRR
jgi:hypothetical protein